MVAVVTALIVLLIEEPANDRQRHGSEGFLERQFATLRLVDDGRVDDDAYDTCTRDDCSPRRRCSLNLNRAGDKGKRVCAVDGSCDDGTADWAGHFCQLVLWERHKGRSGRQ